MNRKTATIFCALMIGASSMTPAASLPGAPLSGNRSDEMSVRIKQNDITITCPDRVTYQAQPIQDWNVGMHSIKTMKFEDATVDRRTLNCNYSGKGGGDWSVLMRETPPGYICTTDNRHGSKNWQFLCKRAVPPIKVKPKSE